MAHDNAILRHFVACIVFLEVPILERNTYKLWSNLTGLQTFHCWLSNSQTHPDHSQSFWQPTHDLVSVLRSLVSCILPRLLSFLGCHYSHVLCQLCNATWMAHQHSSVWSKNGIGHHQTIKWLVIKPPMRVGFSTDRPTLCQFMDGFAQLVYWQKDRESSGLMVGMFFFTAAALGPHTIPAALCTMPLGPSPLEVLW